MDSIYRWPLANLCYAGICLIVGVICLALSAADDGMEFFGVIGGLSLVVGVLYLIAALWHFAQVLTGRQDQD